MEINRVAVLNALQAVSPGLSRRQTVEEAQNFIFSDGYLTTYNDNICVKYPLDLGIKASVRADKFFSVIKKLGTNLINTEMIDIYMEGDKVVVKCKDAEAKVNSVSIDRFEKFLAKLNVSGLTGWKDVPENFLAGLELCSFSTSKDKTKEYTTCVFVNGDSIFSTDSLRVSRYVLDESVGDFLIPATSIKQLLKYNLEKYIVDEKWIHFLTGEDAVFSCRLSLADQVDLRGFFKSVEEEEVEGEEIVLPDDLQDAVQFVGIFAEGAMTLDLKINITIEKGKIILESKRSDGTSKKSINIDYDGDPVKFSVHPEFFSQVLRYATKLKILKKKKALFTQGKFTHVLSLHLD